MWLESRSQDDAKLVLPSDIASLPHVRGAADTAKYMCPNLSVRATERLDTAKAACLGPQILVLTKQELQHRSSPGLTAIRAVAVGRLIFHYHLFISQQHHRFNWSTFAPYSVCVNKH